MPLISKEEESQNLDDQLTEKEVLTSIFDDAVDIDEQVISINIESQYFFIVLRCLLTTCYPSKDPPIFTIIEEGDEPRIDLSALERELENSFVPGEAVIYEWVVYLKEYLEKLDGVVDSAEDIVETEQIFDYSKESETEVESLESVYSNYTDWSKNKQESDQSERQIFTGEILTDRKSHFQAHVCRISSVEEVRHVVETLLQNPKIASAAHNIMAYRFRNSADNICQDYDEDGETKAGGRLLELLELMRVENITCVVSRWYGGTNLGPIRFKHINNVARETILASGVMDEEDKGTKVKDRKK